MITLLLGHFGEFSRVRPFFRNVEAVGCPVKASKRVK
jgi:hypothetical protein